MGESRYPEGLALQSVRERLLALHRELERGTQNGEDPADSATRPEDLVVGWALQSGNVDKLAQVRAARAASRPAPTAPAPTVTGRSTPPAWKPAPSPPAA